MRNPTSPGGTPSQHNSTLAISPLIINRTARYQVRNSNNQLSSNVDILDNPSLSNTTNNHNNNPFQTSINSPLGQKVPKNSCLNTDLTTPRQPKNGALNNNLTSNVSNNTISITNHIMSSTLRKLGLQKNSLSNGIQDINNSNQADYVNNMTIDSVIDNNTNSNNNDKPLVTTLTTNSAPVTTLNDIDITKLSSIERLRLWRHDALMQHMYTTAEYIGDKIYSITNDPNDAFWLAQVYYDKQEYQRVIDLLTTTGTDDMDYSNSPSSSLVTINIMCRYLVALCYIQLQKYEEALDIVGETNPFADVSLNEEEFMIQQRQQTDGGIKLESSLCYLRGKIYCALNDFEKARESFKEAVKVDIKNFEAFDTLTSRYLLTPQEEWDFINELDFSILDDNEEIIKNFYTLKLSKLINKVEITESQQLLSNEYNLGLNSDVVCSKVELLQLQGKFNECLDICEQFLSKDSFNLKLLPTYITCLFELSAKNKLFLLSHKLAENLPKSPITWFSVATYYLTINKFNQARKFFSKASILDPTFAPAWLGFAHTFSLEGEQDQALTAYSTAARFFPGSHLPYLFLGMQYMTSNTLSLAEDYFNLSYGICPTDPLLLNEMGCLYYKKEEFEKSKKYLNKALEKVKDVSPTSKTAISIQTNLGHTYKRLGENERAIKCFRFILEDSEKDSDVYCTLGFLYLKTNQLEKAIDYLHKSLAVCPSNTYASDLLQHALELNVSLSLTSDHPLAARTNFENLISNIDNYQSQLNKKESYSNTNITEKIIDKIQRKRLKNPIFQPSSHLKKPRSRSSQQLFHGNSLGQDESMVNDDSSIEPMDVE